MSNSITSETLKGMIKSALLKHLHLRDSDNLLMSYIWSKELIEHNKPTETHLFREFLIDFIEGRHTSAESVRRTRQLVQKLFPETRGEKYNARLKKGEQIKKSI